MSPTNAFSKEQTITPRGAAKYLALALVVGLAIAGVGTLAASFISLPAISGTIVGGGHGDDQLQRGADSLAQNFGGIVVRLRYASAGLLLAALLAGIQWRKVRTWIEQAVFPLPRFLRGVAASIVSGLKTDGWLHVCGLLTLCVVGASVRYHYLFQPIRIDEAETFLSYASRPLYVGLSWYPAPNNHLLNTLLIHFVWRVFGDREWVVRLPALVAGILLIPLTYWAARALYDKHVALIAASLVTAASPLIHYSVDGRGYSMVCVLFLLLLIVSRQLIEQPSRPEWLLWVLVAILGFYAIPIMLYAAAIAAVWLSVSSRGRQLAGAAAAWAFTASVTTLLYLPVLIASGPKALLSNSWVANKSFTYFFTHASETAVQAWRLWTMDVPLPVVVILSVGLGLAVVFDRRIPGYGIPVLFAAALCIPPLLLAQRVVPYGRVWLFLLPVCAAFSAAGIWLLSRGLGWNEGRLSWLSAAIALCCFVGMSVPDLRGTRLVSRASAINVEDAAVWIKGHLTPGEIVVVKGAGWSPLTYYFRRHGIPLVSRPAPCDSWSLVYYPKGAMARRPAGEQPRVLTVSTSGQEPDTVLSIACMTWQPSSAPSLVYSSSGLKIHEGFGARVQRQAAH